MTFATGEIVEVHHDRTYSLGIIHKQEDDAYAVFSGNKYFLAKPEDLKPHEYPKRTGKEALEFVIEVIKMHYPNFEETPEELWNASPTGELYHVSLLYWWACDFKMGWIPFEAIPYRIDAEGKRFVVKRGKG